MQADAQPIQCRIFRNFYHQHTCIWLLQGDNKWESPIGLIPEMNQNRRRANTDCTRLHHRHDIFTRSWSRSHLPNQKTWWSDQYPVDLNAAYSILVNYHLPTQSRPQQTNQNAGQPATYTNASTVTTDIVLTCSPKRLETLLYRQQRKLPERMEWPKTLSPVTIVNQVKTLPTSVPQLVPSCWYNMHSS